MGLPVGQTARAHPEFHLDENPNYRTFFRQRKFWKCSAARSIENFFDFAHFPWVHEGILGERDHSLVSKTEFQRDGESLMFSLPSDGVQAIPQPCNYRVTRPFTILQWNADESVKTDAFFYAVTPHSINESTRYLLITRNYDLDAPEVKHGPAWMDQSDIWLEDKEYDGVIPEHIRTKDFIAEQDEPIVSNQRPWELPLDLSEELHLKTPDAAAVHYRRFMRELGVDVDAG